MFDHLKKLLLPVFLDVFDFHQSVWLEVPHTSQICVLSEFFHV